ncbi:MAG: GNAT family N-acetyltransferase [Promethearchaeota archaeon]
MTVRLIASQEAEIANYQDQFLGLKTIFEETQYPYWILVDDQTVMGLIVVSKEPREFLQPASTTFVQIYLFRHQPNAVKQLLSQALNIAAEHQAAYTCCKVSADQHETVQLLEQAELTLYDETVKMGAPLDNVVPPETTLTFNRTSPEETALVLENLASSLADTPGRLLKSVIHNIQSLPSNQLDTTLSQMEVILVKDTTKPVGILSLEGPTISMLGVQPEVRGKGYGQVITQWAKNHLSQQGHFRAWLRVSTANAKAIHIFEKFGFKVTEHLRYYLKTNPNIWQENPP